jgi:hypothetical protein
MDAISLDEWELLPDHKSSFFPEEHCSNGGHGAVGGGKDQLLLGAELFVIDMDHFAPAAHPPPCDGIPDEEAAAKKPSQDACVHDPDTEFMDIAALLTDPKREELVSKVIEIPIYEAEEDRDDETTVVKEADKDGVMVEAEAPGDQRAGEEEEEGGVSSRTGFSVGNLRVNGVGALCSFGVAAATFVIFLLGGKQQQQQQSRRHQDHKIQHQMYADDEVRGSSLISAFF